MNKETWKEWFQGQVENSTMKVTEISLLETAPDWRISVKTRNFSRADGEFFQYAGVSVETQGGREVRRWKQPIIKQPGIGYIIFIVSKGEFLLQAKAEPGNDPKSGFLQLNAPLSASLSNLKGAHGGKRPPRAELLDGKKYSLTKISVPQDGGKYLGKVNEYGFIRIEEKESVGLLNANERWFKKEELTEALKEGLLADHLLQALSVYYLC